MRHKKRESEKLEDQDILKDILRPMSEFIEFGLLHALNRDVMIPRGLYLGMYIDDETGQTCMGWNCITYTEARALKITPSPEKALEREAALANLVIY